MKRESEHQKLVEKGRVWLFRNCPIVLTEIHSVSEAPDVLGFQNGISILIECKASISDYYSDGRKHFREYAEQGIGDYRYYLTPKGLLAKTKLREGWGLLELSGNRVAKVKEANKFPIVNKWQEIALLQSAIRRIGQTKPQGVSIKAYYQHISERASLSVEID